MMSLPRLSSLAGFVCLSLLSAAPASAQLDAPGQKLQVNEGFDFAAGSETLIASDFSGARIGAMPAQWKTNGSGSVVTVDGLPGNWLALQPLSTYKLSETLRLPDTFTVEFDIVPVAETTSDADGFFFGFAEDNSAQDYIRDHNNGGIATIEINFTGKSSVSSGATGHFHARDLDFHHYANRIMHVSIEVDGDMMRVYLDREKIVDTRLFKGDLPKHFFLSAPPETENGAQLLFGNFKLAK